MSNSGDLLTPAHFLFPTTSHLETSTIQFPTSSYKTDRMGEREKKKGKKRNEKNDVRVSIFEIGSVAQKVKSDEILSSYSREDGFIRVFSFFFFLGVRFIALQSHPDIEDV